MSTTTTTTRDRGDRYGPMEWAQKERLIVLARLVEAWCFLSFMFTFTTDLNFHLFYSI